MQSSLEASRTITGEPSLSHWGFAPQVAMALVVIVLLTFMVAALEVFLSGNESLKCARSGHDVLNVAGLTGD
jgi:hypothetical protein